MPWPLVSKWLSVRYPWVQTVRRMTLIRIARTSVSSTSYPRKISLSGTQKSVSWTQVMRRSASLSLMTLLMLWLYAIRSMSVTCTSTNSSSSYQVVVLGTKPFAPLYSARRKHSCVIPLRHPTKTSWSTTASNKWTTIMSRWAQMARCFRGRTSSYVRFSTYGTPSTLCVSSS